MKTMGFYTINQIHISDKTYIKNNYRIKMPRKAKPKEIVGDNKKSKKNLLNTMVKNVEKDEHFVLQLPLSQNHIDNIINKNKNKNSINDPVPYEKNCCFLDESHNAIEKYTIGIETVEEVTESHIPRCCFWCCHDIEYKSFGMPVNYDTTCDTYTTYGSFCSLQCANAYNFSVNRGSDVLWEINSMIQMIGKRHGITNFIRPAPSKYLLKMFNGFLSIEDFRKLHHNDESSHILNLPPMISIPSGYEVVNTSYIKKNSEC